MGWLGHLAIDYRHDGERCIALDRHEGPLRVLQRLYPEGPGICHHVLVHPPGGIVGGDRLEVALQLATGSHAVLTTPGATRFYRSAGEPAVQQVQAHVAAGARLEWLPMETIAYDACLAENHQRFTLDEGGEMLGWDMTALGLPASGLAFERGHLLQHLEVPGVWLERGRLAADDRLLLDSPVGLAGHRVMGTLWWAGGSGLGTDERQAMLDSAREAMEAHTGLRLTAGATSPDPRIVVCRALAHRVEPLFELWREIRGRWRGVRWGLAGTSLRLWSQ